MSQIVHSRNLFIDTTSGNNQSQGDDFNLELGGNMLQAQDGQYNNLYNVNATNNQFRVVSRFGAANAETQFLGLSTLHEIPSGNYKSCGDIAQAFAEVVQAQVQADARIASGNNALATQLVGITTADVQPPVDDGFSATGDRILQFKIVTSVPHTLTSVKIECFERLGEAWMLLGGDRLEDQFQPANKFGLQSEKVVPDSKSNAGK